MVNSVRCSTMPASKFGSWRVLYRRAVTSVVVLLSMFGAVSGSAEPNDRGVSDVANKESIVLGGGCFWCVEAIFQGFRGVLAVESGYAGGAAANPSYEDVSTGTSGHVEVVRVDFDPAEISREQVLTIFFHSHDPTTPNRQGNDVGPQYRSAIFYSDDVQRLSAEKVRDQIVKEKLWGARPVVTEIAPLKAFYGAEDYHQNYYENNKSNGYCSLVIAPKLYKVRKTFSELLK